MRKSKRRNYSSKHHLVPKERMKLKNYNENQVNEHLQRVLILWRTKHDAWHVLFHNLTLREIIELLNRVEQIKYPD